MSQPTRRSVLQAGLIGTAATAATACAPNSSAGSAASGGSAAVTIAVGADAAFAPLYLADETDMFSSAGLTVTLVKTEGGAAPTEAVSAGQALMSGNAPATAMGAMLNAKNLRPIAVFQQSGRYLKVVFGKGVTSPDQIESMGVVPGLGLLATDRYLQSEGIDPASVEHTQISPPDSVTLLERGDIQAFVLWEPWPTRAGDIGGTTVETTGDYGLQYTQWLIADSTWLEEDPDQVQAVVAVIAEACSKVQADPQAAADAMEASVQIPAEQGIVQIQEIDWAVRSLERADVDDAQSAGDFLVGAGLLKGVPDLAADVQLDWVETA